MALIRMGKSLIGIRIEDKYLMERRTPITPFYIRQLIEHEGLKVVVQSSSKRVFADKEFELAGAVVQKHLKDSGVIFGVKEIPPEAFEKGKTYVFFSHVIKGQPYNMPMLQRMMELDCNLIDYECIADENNRRLIFFGRYAGLAGMINSLWSIGQRLMFYGIDNPFKHIRQAHTYDSLDEANRDIAKAGRLIAEKGLPKQLLPFVIGFTGYGNVSVGAQEIAGLLPIEEIFPEDLAAYAIKTSRPANVIYKVIFKEQHLSRLKSGAADFNLQHYYQFPELYESIFAGYLPHLTMLMNCMYWDSRYPRIVTRDDIHNLFSMGIPKLTVIGDITCDPEGSVEITHKGTEIEDPVFVYNPDTGTPTSGFEGRGMLVMAVDILPSELPRDSSESFSEALFPFVKAIAEADYSAEFNELALPAPIKRAMILHNGKLTKDFQYLNEYV